MVRPVFEAHWREPGFTVPNASTYPWQWLWDSCFCALVWADLGDEHRAVQELRTALAHQGPTGFVPHVTYWGDELFLEGFWGRSATSSITQPPMFGHAAVELVRRGIDVPGDVVEGATACLRFLLEDRRRSSGGLVEIVHPWESGADDSPRWDSLVAGELDGDAWYHRKGEMVRSIRFDDDGAPVDNHGCAVGSTAFSALVAWNALELVTLTGDGLIRDRALELAEALSTRWDAELVTWVDDGPTAAGSGRARTLEALLGALVDPDPDHVGSALDQLVDPKAFGAAFGPAGVDRREPAYDAATYWRGPAWPQLSYLAWCAARAAQRTDVADAVAASLVAGAEESGLAEHWDPDTAQPGGAVPQSWTGLAFTVARIAGL
jgi:hypothetical protein